MNTLTKAYQEYVYIYSSSLNKQSYLKVAHNLCLLWLSFVLSHQVTFFCFLSHRYGGSKYSLYLQNCSEFYVQWTWYSRAYYTHLLIHITLQPSLQKISCTISDIKWIRTLTTEMFCGWNHKQSVQMWWMV